MYPRLQDALRVGELANAISINSRGQTLSTWETCGPSHPDPKHTQELKARNTCFKSVGKQGSSAGTSSFEQRCVIAREVVGNACPAWRELSDDDTVVLTSFRNLTYPLSLHHGVRSHWARRGHEFLSAFLSISLTRTRGVSRVPGFLDNKSQAVFFIGTEDY